MTWRNTYFLPEEVWIHNTSKDCWLTIYGVVKNVTGLIEEFQDSDLISPIIREAGQDVSYWFEMDGLYKPVLKTHLHPKTGARESALPFKILHEPIFEPYVSRKSNSDPTLWWQDEKYNIGMETARPINVRIMNPLIKRTATIRVCLEDTVDRIMERYSVYNPQISCYTVKYVGLPLDRNRSLPENGVTLEFNDLVEDYVPTLMLYYQERLAACRNLILLN